MEKQEEPVAQEAAVEQPAKEEQSQEDGQSELAVEPEEPKEPEEPEEPVSEEPEEAAPEEFVVTEEVYTETFEDIRSLIGELNSIIRSENYDVWLDYLTEAYIDHFSSSQVLRENSDQPLLKKYDINLRTLKDYFRYVVVPSRSNARLDDLVFIDKEHVKAIMIIKDQRTILYRLSKIDRNWKIDL